MINPTLLQGRQFVAVFTDDDEIALKIWTSNMLARAFEEEHYTGETYAPEVLFTLVNKVLVRVEVSWSRESMDENDVIHYRGEVHAHDSDEPVLTVWAHIDGRA